MSTKKVSLSSLLRNNRILLIFSFIASVIIWLLVTTIYLPDVEKTITDVPVTVPISTVDSSGTLKVFGMSVEKVSVTVKGKKYLIDQLTSDSFNVSVNLSGVSGAGDYELPLIVSSNTSYVSALSETTVTVVIDTESTIRRALSISCDATVPANTSDTTYALSTSFADPANAEIQISGPSREIAKVATASAVCGDQEQITESTTYLARVVLYNTAGETIYDSKKGSTTDTKMLKYTKPELAEVNVKADVKMTTQLPVTVQTLNAPVTKPSISVYPITDGTASPNTVSKIGVSGDAAVIHGLSGISLVGTVDFSTKSETDSSPWVYTFSLPAIDGINYIDYTYDSAFEVRVTSKATLRTASFVAAESITVRNLPSDVTATVVSAIDNVTVVGPSAIKNLDSTNLSATVDYNEIASQVTAGTADYKLTPVFVISNYNSAWVYGSYQVTVRITHVTS